MDIEVPELRKIDDTLTRIENRLSLIEEKIDPQRLWFDLKAAASLKGIPYNSINSRPRLQPHMGQPDAIISGRKRWRRETILAWLEETDNPNDR